MAAVVTPVGDGPRPGVGVLLTHGEAVLLATACLGALGQMLTDRDLGGGPTPEYERFLRDLRYRLECITGFAV